MGSFWISLWLQEKYNSSETERLLSRQELSNDNDDDDDNARSIFPILSRDFGKLLS